MNSIPFHPILLLAASLLLSAGCNLNNSQSEKENGETTELDLTQWDYPLSLKIPDSSHVGMIINNTENGLEINAGRGFIMIVREGTGDIELKKKDLLEDAVFKTTFLKEENSGLLYRSEIQGTDIAQQHHFFVVLKTSAGTYEIMSQPMETFSEQQAEAMYKAAKEAVPLTADKPS